MYACGWSRKSEIEVDSTCYHTIPRVRPSNAIFVASPLSTIVGSPFLLTATSILRLDEVELELNGLVPAYEFLIANSPASSGSVQSARGLCRNLIIESHTSWSRLCNSTFQGRHLRSDDRGYVCSIRGLNPRTGCCIEESLRYSCLTFYKSFFKVPD
ncbi:hypothetical protein R1flu_004099 [Riccia fluitans]|uniref:Uncharacterized protein n=1 Tax=Riccia fluitans TaxID=41844 RepID=A0ABD1YQ51_9MARC